MALGRDRAHYFLFREVNDCNAGLVPQAHVQEMAPRIDGARIRITLLFQRNGVAILGIVERHDGDRMPPGSRGEQRAARAIDGEPADDEGVTWPGHWDRAMAGGNAHGA